MLILGIYEGETIAHPMIASGDARTLRWILTDDERGKFDEGTRVDSVGQIKQRLTAACYSLVFLAHMMSPGFGQLGTTSFERIILLANASRVPHFVFSI